MNYFYTISISWVEGGVLKHRTTHGNADRIDCSGCRYIVALKDVADQGGVDQKKVTVTNYFEGPSCGDKHAI